MPRTTQEETALLERLADRFVGNGGLRRALRIACWATLIGGITFSLAFFLPELRRQRSLRTADRPARMVLENPTEWFANSPELMQRLERIVLENAGNDPMDRDGLVLAHDALERSGWFTSIERLERRADGTILVRGELAQPFAVVRWGNWDHLVDLEGRLLDWPCPAGQANPLLPVLTGARTPPPVDGRGERVYGAHWADAGREIEAGLTLARAMHGRPWVKEIRRIEVGDYPERRCLWLETETGPRIRWGLAPDEVSASELTTQDKLRTLDRIHRTYGPLAGLQRSELDIRHDVSTRTRLVAE